MNYVAADRAARKLHSVIRVLAVAVAAFNQLGVSSDQIDELISWHD